MINDSMLCFTIKDPNNDLIFGHNFNVRTAIRFCSFCHKYMNASNEVKIQTKRILGTHWRVGGVSWARRTKLPR